MNRNVHLLLAAQFLSAFADNALLFAAIALVLHSAHLAAWYIPALQASFLVAFVIFAPWVGVVADRHSKVWVLFGANGIKALGAGLLMIGVDPLAAYAVAGIGAAFYGPAKYGILPELLGREQLVAANGLIEGTTIMAIVSGALAGGSAADRSVPLALMAVIGCYLASALIVLGMTRTPIRVTQRLPAVRYFADMTRTLLSSSRALFATLGVTLFWSSAAVLRVMVVAWAPIVLELHSTEDIAALTLFSAIGVAVGAFIAPRLIPLDKLHRARVAAYGMGICIILLAITDALWPARLALLVAGIAGGIFVVPVNATLQEIGHRTLGAGGAVAVQQFFENLGMLAATGVYAYAAGQGADPVLSLLTLGVLVMLATTLVSWHLPDVENSESGV
jgi:LPLT family lysophospholipid transporter-like MFS transporter